MEFVAPHWIFVRRFQLLCGYYTMYWSRTARLLFGYVGTQISSVASVSLSHLRYVHLDLRLPPLALLVVHAGQEEERGGEEQHHHGRGGGLRGGAAHAAQPAVADEDLVQALELARQRLVLRLELLDLLVQLLVLLGADANAVLHLVHVLLLALAGVLRRDLQRGERKERVKSRRHGKKHELLQQ